MINFNSKLTVFEVCSVNDEEDDCWYLCPSVTGDSAFNSRASQHCVLEMT